jgi:hypothetical protein
MTQYEQMMADKRCLEIHIIKDGKRTPYYIQHGPQDDGSITYEKYQSAYHHRFHADTVVHSIQRDNPELDPIVVVKGASK